jgi:hypothetical protein
VDSILAVEAKLESKPLRSIPPPCRTGTQSNLGVPDPSGGTSANNADDEPDVREWRYEPISHRGSADSRAFLMAHRSWDGRLGCLVAQAETPANAFTSACRVMTEVAPGY